MKFLPYVVIYLLSLNLTAQSSNKSALLGESGTNQETQRYPGAKQKTPLKALIVDGQNNHAVWPKSTIMMKQYLEETGKVTIPVPQDFPTAETSSSREFTLKIDVQ
ncbi:hypothetical protein SAMN04488057_12066 [Cyclobacterium lianum]|uniref:Uncharacterized protein n=1 Tax=Cyclobacterium lianum TaxID=388280 RepID=A0A1M7QMW7_9BACT|nr:hypothetical protein SAMN04488057_12066 [Cyclobacterium lianum]